MSDTLDPFASSSCCAAEAPQSARNPEWLRGAYRRLLSPWTITLGVPLAVLVLDGARFLEVTAFALRAFGGTLPYIALAVVLIAYLKASGAEATIGKAFRGREAQAIVLAALLGGLAPFCSCEVIPFVAGLLAVGAPLSAIMAFWLSSPLIDPPTLLITAGALGWPFAIGKAVSAVALGLLGGVVIAAFTRAGALNNPGRGAAARSCGCGPAPLSGKPVWAFWREEARKDAFGHELRVNALFLAKWLALAYVLEAILVTYVPADFIGRVVGGEGVVPILVAAAVGMPAYLNGYVAAPLIGGLVEQGMSAGAAMAFMVAGPVSSIPAMAAVWSLVRANVFALYLGLGFIGAVFSGILYQISIG